MIQPPITGPRIGATTTPCANAAIATPRFCGGKLSSMMAWAIGTIAPPPTPCKIRARINVGRLHASPHSTEAIVNITMHESRTRLRPK